jgi:hypothetical protein
VAAGGTGVDVGWASAATGHAAASCGRRGGQLRPEALPVRELDELALLDGPSKGLLLQQVRRLVLLYQQHRRLLLLIFLRRRHPVR